MSNKFPLPKKHLIGHRGVAGLRPENTLCSLSYASELGLNWIEFDVQLSKDREWVVLHDETLERTTTGRGMVADHTQEQLASLEAGLWFRPSYPGEHVPTLVETLELARSLDLFCNVELKAPDDAASLYADQFIAFIKKHQDLTLDRIILSTFNRECAMQLRKSIEELALNIPVAFLTEQVDSEVLQMIKSYGFAALNCDVDSFNKELLINPPKSYRSQFFSTLSMMSVQRVFGSRTESPAFLQIGQTYYNTLA